MDKICVPAPAKINLILSVTGLRPDGFHDLKMIMQTISLHDILYIKKSRSEIKINSTDENLPRGKANLAYQAAESIFEYTNTVRGVDIFIDKKIPIAAGLAGGSADAAAVLRGINELYKLNLSGSELKDIAAGIGSDVPFCLQGGTAFASGRGTDIEQLPDIARENFIIACPPVKISTAEIYSAYDKLKDKKEFLDIPVHKFLEIIKSNKEIKWDEGWYNILEPVTIEICEEIKKIKEIFSNKGVKFSQMTGSGPAVFAVVDNRIQAEQIINNWPGENDFLSNVFTLKKDFPELYSKRETGR